MKPKPLAVLKNFTMPLFMTIVLSILSASRRRRAGFKRIDFERKDQLVRNAQKRSSTSNLDALIGRLQLCSEEGGPIAWRYLRQRDDEV